jgi:hypothetical protein
MYACESKVGTESHAYMHVSRTVEKTHCPAEKDVS